MSAFLKIVFRICSMVFFLTVPLQASNLLQNPRFTSSLAGWTAGFYNTAAWDPFDHGGGTGSFLGQSLPTPYNLEVAVSQCVPATPGVTYAAGASFWTPEAIAADVQVLVAVRWFTGGSCESGELQGDVLMGLSRVVHETWTDAQATATAPAGSVSAWVTFAADADPSAIAQIRVYIDDAYFLSDQTCAATESHLCLNEGRFRVSGSWHVPSEDRSGYARALAATPDSGLFWFFAPDNLEIFLKVLNACGDPFQHYWVFVSGLTNVDVTLTVEDTVAGERRLYSNSGGTAFPAILDTSAFATCP